MNAQCCSVKKQYEFVFMAHKCSMLQLQMKCPFTRLVGKGESHWRIRANKDDKVAQQHGKETSFRQAELNLRATLGDKDLCSPNLTHNQPNYDSTKTISWMNFISCFVFWTGEQNLLVHSLQTVHA